MPSYIDFKIKASRFFRQAACQNIRLRWDMINDLIRNSWNDCRNPCMVSTYLSKFQYEYCLGGEDPAFVLRES